MTKFICFISILALLVAGPARAAEPAANEQQAPNAPSPAASAADECDARMQKLEQSPAEGEDRLREKYAVVEFCDEQYKNDKTIERLVNECAKYVEQPVVKQQFAASCMLAAYGYANALYALKEEYGK
jgi:hypothetical protein